MMTIHSDSIFIRFFNRPNRQSHEGSIMQRWYHHLPSEFGMKHYNTTMCCRLMGETSENFPKILRQESIHWKIVTSALACSATWRLIITSQRAGAGPRFLGLSFTSQQILKPTNEFTSGPFPTKTTEHRSASFPPLVPGNCWPPTCPLFLPQNQLATVEVHCSPKYFDPSEGQGKTLLRLVASWTDGRVESDSQQPPSGTGCFWNPVNNWSIYRPQLVQDFFHQQYWYAGFQSDGWWETNPFFPHQKGLCEIKTLLVQWEIKKANQNDTCGALWFDFHFSVLKVKWRVVRPYLHAIAIYIVLCTSFCQPIQKILGNLYRSSERGIDRKDYVKPHLSCFLPLPTSHPSAASQVTKPYPAQSTPQIPLGSRTLSGQYLHIWVRSWPLAVLLSKDLETNDQYEKSHRSWTKQPFWDRGKIVQIYPMLFFLVKTHHVRVSSFPSIIINSLHLLLKRHLFFRELVGPMVLWMICFHPPPMLADALQGSWSSIPNRRACSKWSQYPPF